MNLSLLLSLRNSELNFSLSSCWGVKSRLPVALLLLLSVMSFLYSFLIYFLCCISFPSILILFFWSSSAFWLLRNTCFTSFFIVNSMKRRLVKKTWIATRQTTKSISDCIISALGKNTIFSKRSSYTFFVIIGIKDDDEEQLITRLLCALGHGDGLTTVGRLCAMLVDYIWKVIMDPIFPSVLCIFFCADSAA